ncbi:MAG: LacI family transcriptional regulator [Anaerolineae bacterium]|nr:LacI family transcriptional regulator [Anaerolineae bacterium]MDW8071153.1 LacI family DNA-binding transcriptional regulator [Anaerolineae bacterium]
MKRRVTIEDVARMAGVSRQTVSRAINNKGEISPLTLERVMNAIHQLGYRPSWVARGLATQRTRTLGLVVPDITNPFFPEVARGVQDAAHTQGYHVFLYNTDESAEREYQILYSLAAQLVDGILLFGSRIADAELRAFVEHYRPLVVLNRHIVHPGVGMVLVDNLAGARLAVEHLVRRGHRYIGMLAGPLTSPSSMQRVAGFRNALAEHQLPFQESYIAPGPPTLDGGRTITEQLLRRHPEITALLAYNDVMALGAVQTYRTLGYRIPEQRAVVGFDDIWIAALTHPALTTIRVNKYEVGYRATQCLLSMIEDVTQCPPAVEIGVELVIRESA